MRKQYSQPSMSVQTFVIVGQTLCASSMPVGGSGSQGTARMPGRIIED
ncbi:MAG: hypothetical protein IJU36_06125 [Paludibacteraceae bacterium]|nr:hypothetical protein [Paludibacteraceae bacterium]